MEPAGDDHAGHNEGDNADGNGHDLRYDFAAQYVSHASNLADPASRTSLLVVANAPHTSNTALQGMIIALGVDAETVQIIDSLEDLEAKQQCRDIIVSMCDAARTMGRGDAPAPPDLTLDGGNGAAKVIPEAEVVKTFNNGFLHTIERVREVSFQEAVEGADRLQSVPIQDATYLGHMAKGTLVTKVWRKSFRGELGHARTQALVGEYFDGIDKAAATFKPFSSVLLNTRASNQALDMVPHPSGMKASFLRSETKGQIMTVSERTKIDAVAKVKQEQHVKFQRTLRSINFKIVLPVFNALAVEHDRVAVLSAPPLAEDNAPVLEAVSDLIRFADDAAAIPDNLADFGVNEWRAAMFALAGRTEEMLAELSDRMCYLAQVLCMHDANAHKLTTMRQQDAPWAVVEDTFNDKEIKETSMEAAMADDKVQKLKGLDIPTLHADLLKHMVQQTSA